MPRPTEHPCRLERTGYRFWRVRGVASCPNGIGRCAETSQIPIVCGASRLTEENVAHCHARRGIGLREERSTRGIDGSRLHAITTKLRHAGRHGLSRKDEDNGEETERKTEEAQGVAWSYGFCGVKLMEAANDEMGIRTQLGVKSLPEMYPCGNAIRPVSVLLLRP